MRDVEYQTDVNIKELNQKLHGYHVETGNFRVYLIVNLETGEVHSTAGLHLKETLCWNPGPPFAVISTDVKADTIISEIHAGNDHQYECINSGEE